MNTFGNYLRFTSFGESHGVMVGGVLDGCPAGLVLDMEAINDELRRRRPGHSSLSSMRKESDSVEFVSGLFQGVTTGAPIAFFIKNEDCHPQDYERMKDMFRPSHADYTYLMKYGVRDYRGGGRSSARETATRVVAGAIAKQWLSKWGIKIQAYTSQIGHIALEKDYKEYDLDSVAANPVCCPLPEKAMLMQDLIEQVKNEGDAIGGTITCVIANLPVGLGSPVFAKLQAQLAWAMLSINAVKGFEYGSGFQCVDKKASELNDAFCMEKGRVRTQTNFSGGIQGGISNGEDVYFRVAIKPTPSISKPQNTVSVQGEECVLQAKGRHDPCIVPRAIPVVEAMAALVIADAMKQRLTEQ
ncbi:MAG: chorismate synthase [Paludibacteraceae bacterium]|nr:chorismate synthase [Paludibacteraceae bacterium]